MTPDQIHELVNEYNRVNYRLETVTYSSVGEDGNPERGEENVGWVARAETTTKGGGRNKRPDSTTIVFHHGWDDWLDRFTVTVEHDTVHYVEGWSLAAEPFTWPVAVAQWTAFLAGKSQRVVEPVEQISKTQLLCHG